MGGKIYMERRKVKSGERSPWGQCLTRPVPNGCRRSGFWFSGTNQKPDRRRPFGTGPVRHCPQGLFSPFLTFLRVIFFRPFRLFLAPFICPWVSEDGAACDLTPERLTCQTRLTLYQNSHQTCVERVLVGLFFALSRVIFIGVNQLLGRNTKRLNECSLLFSENLQKIANYQNI